MTIKSNHTFHNPKITKAILGDMAETVMNTFGPTGAITLMVNQLGENQYGASATKDGYTVLAKTKYFHPMSIAIKRLVLDTMVGVLQTASDGTTTSTILISGLYNYIEPLYRELNVPAQVFTNIAKKVVKDICNAIDALPKAQVSIEDIYGIIETSTNADEELCETLNAVVDKLSEGGKSLKDISISYTANPNISTSTYKVESGYVIPRATAFEAHDNVEKDYCAVVIINQSIATVDEFKGLLDFMDSYIYKCIKEKMDPRTLLVTYNIHNKEVLEVEVQKRHAYALRNGINKFPISIIEYNEDGTVFSHDEHLDFEALVGQGMKYDITLGKKLDEFFVEENIPEDVPFTKNDLIRDYLLDNIFSYNIAHGEVTFSKTATNITNIKSANGLDTAAIQKEKLERELAETTNDEVKASLRSRINKIDGSYAEIQIGGDNEWDIKRKQDAIDDVVGAIRAAIKSNVCGGLSTIISKVKPLFYASNEDKLENRIYRAIADSLFLTYENITKLLLVRAGLSDKEIEETFRNIVDMNNKLVDKAIKEAIDIRKVLELKGDMKEIDYESIKSYSILNTIDAEKKILEASTNAVLTLLSINQVTLPDQYDTGTYLGENL